VMTLATIVDWEALLDTAIAAIVAGVGITVSVSMAIYGFAHLSEARDDGRLMIAGAAGLVGFAGLALSIGAIVFGIVVMVS
jgi:hypothetical protein